MLIFCSGCDQLYLFITKTVQVWNRNLSVMDLITTFTCAELLNCCVARSGADLVAMVTEDGFIQQVDVERSPKVRDLSLILCFLLTALLDASEGSADVSVRRAAGHRQVAGGGRADGVDGQNSRGDWT